MINPNSDRDYINKFEELSPAEQQKRNPVFFTKIKFDKFRNINNLEVKFNSPITVISGSNKSGKTSILLSIACSHFYFKKKDPKSGTFERTRWGNVMKFTKCDVQDEDWTYYVSYREGQQNITKRGQRKHLTKKWNGVAKKESQIGSPKNNNQREGRNVFLIDLERIVPARQISDALFKKTRTATQSPLSDIVNDYVSYILEENYQVSRICSAANCTAFSFDTNAHYSSFNTASGEDALIHILQGITEAPDFSLILIEEIEIGLHPKIQRRLMDVIYYEARIHHKQFIITTHAPAILTSVQPCSRIFIERNEDTYRAIYNISVSAALSKMDSLAYPLVNVYVEDDISMKLTQKAIKSIEEERKGFKDLLKVIPVGSASDTHRYFSLREKLYDAEDSNRGYACILDGDMRNKYPKHPLLFFHLSEFAPEKMLLSTFLKQHPNQKLEYHLEHSNPHALLEKMVEEGVAFDKDDAFNNCFTTLLSSVEGEKYFQMLKMFLINCVKRFSPDL